MEKGILENCLFEAFAGASDDVYLYVCDMKTNLSRWSRASVEFFGLESEYIMDAQNVWVEYIHPDDREHFYQDITQVMEGVKDHHSCQYRARNKDGEYIWLECKGSVVRDENGEPEAFAGMMNRLDRRSKYDTLTGLLMSHELFNYDFRDMKGIVILLGIDGFRHVIGNYGYNAGDRILAVFGRMLKEACDRSWKVYRFSGDEFAIITSLSDADQAMEFFDRISREADNIELQDGRRVDLSLSGGAVFYPKDADNREELINHLEHSLEYAKSHQRGSLVFFSREIASRHKRLVMLREDLRYSIHHDFQGFELYFQPFIDPTTRRTKGCECLLRWQGQRIKDSYPTEFIKVLEDYGGICEVGIWVMEQAIRQQTEWKKQFGELQVSFNVSYQQFMDEQFERALEQCVERYGCNPSSMILELTESCEVEKPEDLSYAFDKLQSKGFKIAFDDFGTAYASLEMLKCLRVDYIKVEHSFVRELSEPGHDIDYVIIQNLLDMCDHLGCDSIVEGVENEKVADIVDKMNPTLLQGYYFSKPVCKEDFEKLLVEDGKR